MVLMSHLMPGVQPGNIVQGVYPITGLNRRRQERKPFLQKLTEKQGNFTIFPGTPPTFVPTQGDPTLAKWRRHE